MSRRAVESNGARRPGDGARTSFGPTVGILVLAAVLLLPLAGGRPAPASACPFSITLSAEPTAGRAPLVVDFRVSVSNGAPTSYRWAFGDGAYYNGTASNADSAEHEYATAGQFEASVSVAEGSCAVAASMPITVERASLSAGASATPTSGAAPLTVVFGGTAAGGTGTYTSFEWAFGDGGVGSGPTLSYTYISPGTFVAVLVVSDSADANASASVRVNVTAASSTGPTTGDGRAPTLVREVEAGAAVGGVALVVLLWGLLRRRTTMPPTRASGPARPSDAALFPEPIPAVAPTASEPRPIAGIDRSTGPPARAAGAAGDPARSPTTSRGREVLLSLRVVLHIARQGAPRADDVAPNELTQAGMVGSLGGTQSSLAHVLRRLEAAGVVRSEVRHARGRARRVKVYTLSPRGESLARELRARRTGEVRAAGSGQGSAPPRSEGSGAEPEDRPGVRTVL